MSNSLIQKINKEKLKQIVKNSSNINQVLRKIGYTYTGGTNHDLFRKTCQELNIDYSHFTGLSKKFIKRSEENVFCKISPASQATLRSWYFKGNYSEYKCAICGINEWQNKPLTLRLDHINGHNKDNRLENLRWVCPNCDSQLDTFCRGYKTKIEEVKNYCIKCGKEIDKNATLCQECYHIERRIVERPNREELKKLIRTTPFTIIGKQYNVSDNAIRKWCKTENLPSTKKEINEYTDKEWEKI